MILVSEVTTQPRKSVSKFNIGFLCIPKSLSIWKVCLLGKPSPLDC